MANERQVKVTLLGDADHLKRAFEGASGFAGKFGDALGGVAKIAGGFVVGQGILKIPGLLMASKDAASDYNETLSKSNTIFGEQAAEIEKWAAGAAKGFGQSKQQALDSAATFGNLFTQLGIGRDKSAALSQQMVQLASDFASFHNADVTDVLNAQQAAFRGEYDAVQRYVPTINAAAVEQKALAMGLAGSSKELTAQHKALATQQLLLEGAGAAMGDFSRTSGGAANQARIMEARWADVQTRIGQGVLPIFTKIGTVLLDEVFPRVEAFVGAVGPVLGRIGEWIQANVLPRLREFGEFFRAEIMPKLQEFGEFAREKFAEFKVYYEESIKPALENIRDLFAAVIGFVVEHWPEIMMVTGPVIEQVKNLVVTAFDVVRGLIDAVIKLLGGDFSGAWRALGGVVDAVFDGVKGTVKNSVNVIIGLINVMIRALNSIKISIPGIPLPFGRSIPGFDISLPNIPEIPQLAGGGIVRARPGGTLAVIGEGGRDEAVVPLGRGGAGGMTHVLRVELGGQRLADIILEGWVMLENTGRVSVVTR